MLAVSQSISSRAGAFVFLTLLNLAGCASAARPDEGPTADLDVPQPPRTEQSAPASEAPLASGRAPVDPPKDGFTLSNRTGDAIGAACSPSPGGVVRTGPGDIINIDPCGKNQRVSLEIAPMRGVILQGEKPLPCKLEAVGPAAMNEVRACVADDELLVSTVCMVCRMGGGSTIHAHVSQLLPAQADALWKTIGIPGDRPTAASGWAKALAKAKRE